ncbi:MAG: hypothetical protein ACD_32C00110G0012 [uncultured bacterium]|uniref:Glycosyltransferase RgtA/B/C/D-like domain-containing protein n=1 Tax=Candidatus Daviesbacteria bacterium GW2011_GWC2_40_12 TaxID=1618431 RepID=A0A0G0TXD1_9BACT|nr:MAG: hypothetical protein ACD_32C00110G0012 [uncultured bacterium]KKQ82674.1 MAG: hypothetical protein UT04_C0052G0005 [Candidatus Daviesbacteria bacterium GW2011_GWF2_38_7]KKR17218.1 MAG: hypothetical protein UT45_C0002G0047 [Candidatus Daviesbacteria bacterium GW2011_GWA2_39_33]KKR42617.1 MAG: hypothetical protein UT77_C0001G0068 [Candidatus Daviesbacteria bacterium GW2011_GWC2_40_12]OGE21293.1 MAG: hypothetical protein A2778_03950 [Candidatus Daviesbacteria bacterium RIFCSPHIGHO2_01_FULL_
MNRLKIFKNKILLLIVLFTLLGGFFRFYMNTDNPPSLNIDEISYGYSAYSILKTGKDENGIFMPLVFKSIGDYKNPVLIYSLVPSIAIFGLNEFGVRFTTALAGTLSIPVFFLLLRTLLNNTRIAFIGGILLSVSPWHIYYSRYASESLIATFLLMLGIWFFLKIFGGEKWWTVGASLALTLSLYTYHSHRLFIPLFLIFVIFAKIKLLRSVKSSMYIFIIMTFLLIIPLIILVIIGPANTRAKMVFLSLDIDFTRYVILDHLHKQGENFLLLFFWVKRYLNYFQPDFLFFSGLNMTLPGSIGLGVLFLFELPWFVLGIIKLIKDKIPAKLIIVAWTLFGLLPASLTNNEQSTVRSLLVLPALLTVTALGADFFIHLVFSIRNLYLRIGTILTYSIFIAVLLIHAFLVFVVHFPIQRGEDFMEGTKQTVEYALSQKKQYKEIIFDPYRGIEAPYIVSIPHMYILFYSQYDPAIYQQEQKTRPDGSFGFDNFTVRKIDWRVDKSKENTLFIGSPWSLPENELREGEILKKVYLVNGGLAFLIVSPK